MKIPLEQIVKKECQRETNIYGMNAYEHIKSVVKYAEMLAQKRKADEEIVKISAWLHDMGSILGDTENHHVSSGIYAEELLKKYNYPQDKIDAIKHCIFAHRGSQNIKRETIEAECLADADSMSHFDSVVGLFRLALITKKMTEAEAKEFVYNKLMRSWNKLTSEAKDIIKDKYLAVETLLK
ncbi:MAG: HD domain-containing protein [Patescibacteria group bacterium]